jgi:hypothetical protein
MKDGHYITTVIFGNTEIELYGYNHDISYAYINDHDATEMFISLDVFSKLIDAAYDNRPWA